MIKSIENRAALQHQPSRCPVVAGRPSGGCEEYTAAQKTLDSVLAVNLASRSVAYRSVLVIWRTTQKANQRERESVALLDKQSGVDHLIGQKLSQKYRFAEGSARQRRRCSSIPVFAARIQLAQDLLRLGEEVEGWRLARKSISRTVTMSSL